MIPAKFLRKMGIYNFNFNGESVRVKVVDNEDLVDTGVAELTCPLDTRFPIVGYDLKVTEKLPCLHRRPDLLLLYVRGHCLIVQLGRMYSFPVSLSEFLSDQSVCFLSLRSSYIHGRLERCLGLSYSSKNNKSILKTGVDIGTFAARALKNRALEGCEYVEELASKAGFRIEEQASET